MTRMALLLGCKVVLAHGHFIWLNTHKEQVALTFSETAGAPSIPAFLELVLNKTEVWAQGFDGKRMALPLHEHAAGPDRAELLGNIPVAPPFLLEATCTFGIFGARSDELLKYYASADRVTTQRDWFTIQDMARAQLEVTLRDPWMNPAANAHSLSGLEPGMGLGLRTLTPGAMPPGYECPQGASTYQGDACVVAVVRFNGSLIEADCNVTTLAANGTRLRTTFLPASALGVALLRVPLVPGATAFALVNFREPAAGEYEGQPYNVIDHWASTSMVLQRSGSPAESSASIVV